MSAIVANLPTNHRSMVMQNEGFFSACLPHTAFRFFFFWFSAGASKNANQPKHDEIIFKILK